MDKNINNSVNNKKANISAIFIVVLLWVWTASTFYSLVFTKYGLFSFISLLRQNIKSEKLIQDLENEKFALYHRINLIKNNDIDLIEELSQRILNKSSENSKVIIR